MEIPNFAECHRLRVRRDSCGDSIIAGKLGHLYEHGSDTFGIVFEDCTRDNHPGAHACVSRRKALAGGFVMHQQG